MRITTVVEYLSYVSKNDCEFYRGQLNSKWKLLPSIGRLKWPRACFNIEFGGWQDLEAYLLDEFQNQATPYMSFSPRNKMEWLLHAQHHGLPTRLLDWTTNPLKALFFAVEDHKFDKFEGAVFLCEPSTYSGKTETVKDDERVEFFFSAHLNSRVIAQEGVFSKFPLSSEDFDNFKKFEDLESSLNSVNSLKKVLIPKDSKGRLRSELHKLGVNHRSVYPGLEGVTRTLRSGFRRHDVE